MPATGRLACAIITIEVSFHMKRRGIIGAAAVLPFAARAGDAPLKADLAGRTLRRHLSFALERRMRGAQNCVMREVCCALRFIVHQR